MFNGLSLGKLLDKWLRADIPPEMKNVTLSSNKNALSWRWLFFFKVRIMTLDVNEVFFPSNSGRPAVAGANVEASFSSNCVIVLSFNRILN